MWTVDIPEFDLAIRSRYNDYTRRLTLRGLNPGGSNKLFCKAPRPALGPIQPSIQLVPGLFPWGQSYRSVILSVDLHLEPRLRISGGKQPLSLYASMDKNNLIFTLLLDLAWKPKSIYVTTNVVFLLNFRFQNSRTIISRLYFNFHINKQSVLCHVVSLFKFHCLMGIIRIMADALSRRV
jgi:hypothetical protein